MCAINLGIGFVVEVDREITDSGVDDEGREDNDDRSA